MEKIRASIFVSAVAISSVAWGYNEDFSCNSRNGMDVCSGINGEGQASRRVVAREARSRESKAENKLKNQATAHAREKAKERARENMKRLKDNNGNN